ncbi:cation channel sperm-associated protein 1 [Peromyscus eremicus]|uniref:cation channel sperm-associated protein 1 n=1 Tax=Peromyscus eremicus TaxID=42410 RepID=UPI0027DE821F|nr:cation channel sperm-associated protein 1 [Peromyscus eremicus]
MDKPSKMDNAHPEAHISKVDPSHYSSHSHAHHRPGHNGAHHHRDAHHQPSHNHGGSHYQNESQHFRESSDREGAFSHQSHHHNRSRLFTSPDTVPHHFGGSHDESHLHTESHHHSESHQHGRQHQDGHHYHGGHHRASETLSHISSPESHSQKDASHHGKPHHGHRPDESHHQGHHYGRPHHPEFQYYRRQSYYGGNISFHSSEGSFHQERSYLHGSHHTGHQAHHGEHSHHREHHHHREHRHGEHPHHREHGEHPHHREHGEHPHHREHGEHPHHREHSHHRHQSISQFSATFKSHSTLGISPSPMGTKSSLYSVPQSHFATRSYASRVSSKVHPKDGSKESDSWSEDEQIQKRKRTQRAHKKLHSGNIFQWIWEKISHLLWGLRKMMMSLTQSLGFETFIFIVVCLNTIVLVAQTFTELEIRGEWYFMVLDSIFLSIYVLEAMLKLIALGMEYFYDPWNNLDFFIMVMAVLDFVLLQINSLSYSFYNHSLFRILKVFKSMRALRAIRVLRRLSILTSLHEVTGTLSGSLPSITAILTLMFTCLFLFSVVLRALFRKSDPKRFQNIFTTLFTLFTMLTLDDWSLIYMDSRAQGAWYIIPILMIYIVIQYFIFLNLVIAVLVDNFQMALLKGLEKVKLEKAARVHERLLDDSLTELTQADAEAQMSETALQMQFIERMFSTMTEKQRDLHFQFLQLVASVEQQQQKFRSQASVIDEIVDTAFEAGEEDFGK